MTLKQTARRIGGFFTALVHATALSAPRLESTLRDRH
jgi:hypothetical protein